MVNDYQDSFVVEADTLEECIAQKDEFFSQRGLLIENAWSEEIK